MKKAIKLLTLAVMCALAFVGCKKAEDNAAAAKTFTVGFDAEFPPYGFLGEDGSYKGFDLDLAKEVCQRNGWMFVARPIDWAAKDTELNAGTIDCIWNGFTITDERKEQYTWSSPYVQNKQLILVKKDSGLKAIADLNGKAVAAQDGSSGASALEDALKELQKKDAAFNFKEYKKVKDYVTAKTMLESGAVDAVALDSAVALGFIEKSNGAFVTFVEPLMFESYGVGFKKGNTELRDKVEATLRAMVKDGTVANILKHWKENEAKNGGDGIDFILLP
ncbi:MAG: amino acid ABC transporter substrate-binding protein [Victivallales bacterium]|nr:amino acid ABC transporter substrate-binding protein [Victivallales bacterium]